MEKRQNARYLARVKEFAMTVLGLTMVLTPLALWASPNLTAFYAALITCAAAYGAYLLLLRIGPEDAVPAGRRDEQVSLPPRLINLLQNQGDLSREELPVLRQFVQDNMRKPEEPKDG